MRPRSHAFGAALLFSFGLAPTVVAVGEGRVIGTVIDEAGSPLGGVKLLISSPDFKYRQEKATDALGTFSAIILDAARKYTVRLEKEGYTPYEGPLEVKIEETMRLSFVLSKEAAPLASPMGGASDDALVTLERRKWDPQAFSSRAEFVALFADDFVSAGDGTDISGGVQRKTKAEVFCRASAFACQIRAQRLQGRPPELRRGDRLLQGHSHVIRVEGVCHLGLGPSPRNVDDSVLSGVPGEVGRVPGSQR